MYQVLCCIVLCVFALKVEANELCPDCNVVIIAIDALQAGHVHHLGYPVETTPNIDKLASRGISMSQAISPSSWTVPTYLSIFSSMYPSRHGLTNRYRIFSKEKKEEIIGRK